jgi:hypothetical protein
MKRFALLLLIVAWAVLNAAADENRIALVIGNSAYGTSPLKNPVNDATAMTATLKELGFKVTSAYNVRSYQEMIKLIRDFGQELQKGGVGLFYYAGHGVQIEGNNYLIPTMADIRKEGDVELEAVDLNRVLNEMQYARNQVNIIILDACRDNPYSSAFRSSSRGLASITKPVPDCLIAYATQPNGVARDGDGQNGVFTEELLKAIKTPGLSLTQVMMQVRNGVKTRTNNEQLPWENSLLTRDFYFKPEVKEVAQPEPVKTDAPPTTVAIVSEPVRAPSTPVSNPVPEISGTVQKKYVPADAPKPMKLNFQGTIGIDFPGSHTIEDQVSRETYSSGAGFSTSLEAFIPIKYFMFGLGMEYMAPRRIQDAGFPSDFTPAAAYLPIYLTGKASFPLKPGFYGEVFLNLGYSVFMGNDDYLGEFSPTGGGYAAFGLGTFYRKFLITLSIRSNTGGVSGTDIYGTTYNLANSNLQTNLSFGYRLH